MVLVLLSFSSGNNLIVAVLARRRYCKLELSLTVRFFIFILVAMEGDTVTYFDPLHVDATQISVMCVLNGLFFINFCSTRFVLCWLDYHSNSILFVIIA